ncbi:hypothetical protein [Defluviicoccus vanus]|uniref:DUF484 family protein n=1 Tax=Defluviicoccus vanus TaxID=111831 RepID=A0A7H1N3Z4_9PROT|nr:hypothetical protein [Defluviicoccus vanus]QNT70430.1 hypothetical protein HQ394_15225 [Defluviicoccus vanus]
MDHDIDDFASAPTLFDDACLAGGGGGGSGDSGQFPDAPTPQQVAEYLGQNPDFFVQRSELLRKMTPAAALE